MYFNLIFDLLSETIEKGTHRISWADKIDTESVHVLNYQPLLHETMSCENLVLTGYKCESRGQKGKKHSQFLACTVHCPEFLL